MAKTILNLSKDDNNPLFLGQGLGLQVYTNPTYPVLNELALLQRSQFWTETEIDMGKDAAQWKTLPKTVQDICVLNLSWQTMADSIVGRAPFLLIQPLISNPEFEGMITQWGFFENLHSRAYSNIIQTVFPDPQSIIDQIKENAKAFKRLEPLVGLFDELYRVNRLWEDDDESYSAIEHKKLIIKTVYTIYALESMQFYCSFACTFALAEQDILQGVASNLKMIAKDEALHTRMSLEVLKILKSDPQWAPLIEDCQSDIKTLMTEIMNSERGWAEYIFSEGRSIVGLNSALMDEYLLFIAKNSFSAVGLKFDLEAPEKNPLPWIDTWLSPDKVQVAPQEIQITSYRVGSTDASLDDADFDF